MSGGVMSWKFNKLTHGKLLKTPEWDEWKKAKWLQLDQYYDQGMFGDPTFVTDLSGHI
jgi:formate-dependent nitrite reductase cytochrome c552 subunit